MPKKFVVLFKENPYAPSSIGKDGTLFYDNNRFGGLWMVEAESHSKVVDLVLGPVPAIASDEHATQIEMQVFPAHLSFLELRKSFAGVVRL